MERNEVNEASTREIVNGLTSLKEKAMKVQRSRSALLIGRRAPGRGRTMKDRMVCIGSCVVCLALFGCASEQRRFTGFLRDYSILEPHPTIPGALVYWNRDINPQKYTAVLVEPVDDLTDMEAVRISTLTHCDP